MKNKESSEEGEEKKFNMRKKTKVCKLCGKSYTRVARLKIHERTHVEFFNNQRRQEKGLTCANMKAAIKRLWKKEV